MGNKGIGIIGFGLEGSLMGNFLEGKFGGVGGYGIFDFNGCFLGSGGLLMFVYNVQDEGWVVVIIIVNFVGQVISISINKCINIVNVLLWKVVEEVVCKVCFN